MFRITGGRLQASQFYGFFGVYKIRLIEIDFILCTYKVGDGNGGYATNTITIGRANILPVVYAQSVTNGAEIGVAIVLVGGDADADPLVFAISSGLTNGVLNGTGSNRVYSSTANYYGPDNFTFTVSDGWDSSGTGLLELLVLASNRLPVIHGIGASGGTVSVSGLVQPNREAVLDAKENGRCGDLERSEYTEYCLEHQSLGVVWRVGATDQQQSVLPAEKHGQVTRISPGKGAIVLVGGVVG